MDSTPPWGTPALNCFLNEFLFFTSKSVLASTRLEDPSKKGATPNGRGRPNQHQTLPAPRERGLIHDKLFFFFITLFSLLCITPTANANCCNFQHIFHKHISRLANLNLLLNTDKKIETLSSMGVLWKRT